jgi:hypothetical protein
LSIKVLTTNGRHSNRSPPPFSTQEEWLATAPSSGETGEGQAQPETPDK